MFTVSFVIVKSITERIGKMKRNKTLICGFLFIICFIIWTMLLQTVDVKSIGINSTNIGFATINVWFHNLTGVHFILYLITDWLGLVPVFVCFCFGIMGFVQLIKRRSLLKVDIDIIILGVYYILVIFLYLFFEMVPINYRPILINGFMECSYPSSTTLLVLSVMPTLVIQSNFRIKSISLKRIIANLAYIFSFFMIIGRLVSGVHWLTDIIGSILLSVGLVYVYKSIVMMCYKER